MGTDRPFRYGRRKKPCAKRKLLVARAAARARSFRRARIRRRPSAPDEQRAARLTAHRPKRPNPRSKSGSLPPRRNIPKILPSRSRCRSCFLHAVRTQTLPVQAAEYSPGGYHPVRPRLRRQNGGRGEKRHCVLPVGGGHTHAHRSGRGGRHGRARERQPRFCANSAFASPQKLYAEGGLDRIRSDTEEKDALLLSLGVNVNLAPVCDISSDSVELYLPPHARSGCTKRRAIISAPLSGR